MSEKKGVMLSRPKDKTLEAFKEWVREIVKHITGRDKQTMTEAEWEAAWKKFWGEG